MGSDHFWVNRRTQKISPLPKFIFYSVITSCALGITAFCFGVSSVIPGFVTAVALMLFTVASLAATILIIDSIIDATSRCLKVSKGEQAEEAQMKFLNVAEKTDDSLSGRRNDETAETERNDKTTQDSEIKNYNFLRKFINERFSNRKKPSESSYLLEEFNEVEEYKDSMRESLLGDNSSRTVYGSGKKTTILL